MMLIDAATIAIRYKENVQRQEFKSVESKVRYVPYFKDW